MFVFSENFAKVQNEWSLTYAAKHSLQMQKDIFFPTKLPIFLGITQTVFEIDDFKWYRKVILPIFCTIVSGMSLLYCVLCLTFFLSLFRHSSTQHEKHFLHLQPRSAVLRFAVYSSYNLYKGVFEILPNI